MGRNDIFIDGFRCDMCRTAYTDTHSQTETQTQLCRMSPVHSLPMVETGVARTEFGLAGHPAMHLVGQTFEAVAGGWSMRTL